MSTDPGKSWRIDLARHLRGYQLKFKAYRRWSADWDHDHCAACTTRLAEDDFPPAQHFGYATCDDYPHGADYAWVCVGCFADLKDEMDWTEAWD